MSKLRSSSVLSALLRLDRREIWLFRLAFICSAIAAGAIVLQAYSLSKLLSLGSIERLAPPFSLFLCLAVGFGGRMLAHFARDFLARRASMHLRQRLRFTLFDRLCAGPVQASGRPGGVGAAVMGLCQQVDAIDGYLAHYRPHSVNALVTPMLLAAAAFPVEPVAAMIFLATLPLAPLFLALIGMATKKVQDRQMADLARMGGYFLENLRGLGTLRLLGCAQTQAQKIGHVAEQYRLKTMAVLRYAFLSSAALECLASLAIAMAAVAIGTNLLASSGLDSSSLDSFGALSGSRLQSGLFILILAPEFYLPLRQLAASYHDRTAALSAAEALTRLFPSTAQRATAVESMPGIAPKPPFSVVLQDISFRHPDSRQALFEGLDARFLPGERIALVGPSGCGKSSLLALIFGLLSPERGRMRLNDVERSQMSLAQWQGVIAWQGQAPHLFCGTMRDNLALANPEASDALLAKIADRVGLSEVVAGLPLGWQTPLGEGGRGLSGGQARRLALGRCLLKPAGLVLLDEPTAHLDRDTASAFLDLLANQPRDRIYILATHSHEVACRMDRALTLREGRLARL